MTDTDADNALLVTVRDREDSSLYEQGREAIRTLERGEAVERADTVTFPSEESLARTFNEHTLALLRTIAEEAPGSIRETARFVDRDVKNVHEELTRLEAMGVIRFEEEGRSKRPVFPYDELVITVAFTPADGTAPATP